MNKIFEALKAEMPYKWKVQVAKEWGCECVAYIDARQVMDVLDNVIGPGNWQDEYREVAGKVYCDLSLRINDEWVSKSDCGSESTFEAEKGQASDAFKRAAVKWGIGRFLYRLDTVRLKTVSQGNGKYVPSDDSGRRIYGLTAYIRAMQAKDVAATPQNKEDIQSLCKQIGWSRDDLKGYLKKRNLTWKNLTKKEALGIIRAIEDMLA